MGNILQRTGTIIGFGLFLFAIAYITINWSALPAEVPTHYNALGEADDWGSKPFIYFIPLVSVALWVFIITASKYAKINIPGYDNNDGTPKQKALAQQMMRVLGVELLILLNLMSIKETYNLLGGSISLGIWEMVIFLTVVLGTTLGYTIKILTTK